jgi:hypothetical protein
MYSLYVLLDGQAAHQSEPPGRARARAAALAAEAGLLVAAERRRRVEAVVRVRPDDAGAQPLRHPEDARALLRPHAGREPYGVLFAFSTASSGVRNVSTESTGPKISSCAMR